MICLGLDLFQFVLFEVHQTSQMFRITFFLKFGMFLQVFFLRIFSSPSGTRMVHISACSMMLHRSETLVSFSFSFCSLDWILSID